jgi:hypothetical protein
MHMMPSEVLARVKRAADKLVRHDHELLVLDANERSLTHRLALYLESEFEGWNVDCEYNRNRHDPKVLKLPVVSDVPSDDTDATTVFPDVIVHRRNTDDNLLVIEARKAVSRERGLDQRVKLRAYVQQLGYANAIFVVFDTDDRAAGVSLIEVVHPP